MPRVNILDDILFDVVESPVFVNIHDGESLREVAVRDKKAIVDRASKRVLGVVSRSYCLVTNREALAWAYKCCEAVFPKTSPFEWEVTGADAPQSRGHCFIDLHHKTSKLDFSELSAADRPDAFGPFIRVTNSYNTQRALAFDIGFYRKVCKNGMIVPQSMIQFKCSHSKREIAKTIEFEVDHNQLTQAKAQFGEFVGRLRNCKVPLADFGRLVSAVLLIRPPLDFQPGGPQDSEWEELQKHLAKLSKAYAAQLGENAYAAFNAITDFASRPPENKYVRRERHSLQRRAGVWLAEFSRECRESEFNFREYLEKLVAKNVKAKALAP